MSVHIRDAPWERVQSDNTIHTRPRLVLVDLSQTLQQWLISVRFLLATEHVITGPPTHSVGGGAILFCSLASSSSSVTQRICNVTHQGAARDGGPVLLRPVRATPCLYWDHDRSIAGGVQVLTAGPCADR